MEVITQGAGILSAEGGSDPEALGSKECAMPSLRPGPSQGQAQHASSAGVCSESEGTNVGTMKLQL